MIEFANSKHSLISSLFTALTCANAFDIAPSADTAPPAADEADNSADTDAGADAHFGLLVTEVEVLVLICVLPL